MWVNYHSHSHYCDGAGTLQDYIDQAAISNLSCIGFSSHAPVPFDCTWCMKIEKLPRYIQEIESLKLAQSSLQLYKGLETDYIPGMVSPHTYKDLLDYTVGSIHFVEKLPGGKPWEIDNTHQVFLEGFEKIFKNKIRDVIHRYYELTREMIQNACPDVVGHLDKIKIQNKSGLFYKEDEAWYREEVTKTLDVIGSTNAIIEVNTRGLYQKKSDTPYPSPWILEIIHKRNLPITLSSDAHHPRDIVNQFTETAALLSKIGFTKLHILKDGFWQPVSFNQHGID